MMRLRLFTLILFVAVVATACGAQVSAPPSRGGSASDAPSQQTSPAPGGSAPTSSPPDSSVSKLPLSLARSTVRAYVDAWDHHDPAAICREQSATMRRWETSAAAKFFGGRVSCLQIAKLAFHPLQDNPPAVFKHVAVADWGKSWSDGNLAAVPVSLHVTFPDGQSPINDPQGATIFLTDDGGSWRVLDDGGLTDIVAGSSPDVTNALTPLTATDIASPLRMAPAAAVCSGPRIGGSDPADDVHDLLQEATGDVGPVVSAPWVDIRNVALYDLHGQHPCAEVTFSQPLRAGTTIEFLADGNMVAVLALGKQLSKSPEWSSIGNARTMPPFGERGTTLTFLFEHRPSDWASDSISVCASQPLANQPLLAQFSEPQDTWGHGSSTPLGVCQ
jgi:hypothetical protein